MLKMMIVEDQILIRDALACAISRDGDIAVVSSIGDARLALSQCQKQHIDIILMDVCTLENASGLDAAEQIKQHFPHIKIIIVTGLPEITFIERARKIGVNSFVYKDISMDDLRLAVRNTMKGYSTYPMESINRLTMSYVEFTEKEKIILKMICDGLTRMDISQKLNITENTVKTHFSHLMAKTGYTSISKLAIYALTNGLIHPKL